MISGCANAVEEKKEKKRGATAGSPLQYVRLKDIGNGMPQPLAWVVLCTCKCPPCAKSNIRH